MISSLLYPWTYGESGECNLAYLNNAFVETALESPDQFIYVPISDLEPVWDFEHKYHPIHPANKYDVGGRMAKLAIVNVYGGSGQKRPAYLDSFEKVNGRLRLHFTSAGSGLYVTSRTARGLYVAGGDGHDLPAEYAILSSDTMEVWNEEISDPYHAAYAVLSMEPKCNVFAGDYPLTPFYTDKVNRLRIEARPWYDTAVTSVWVCQHLDENVQDVFFHPVWQPLSGTEICPDSAFRYSSEASLRVCSEEENFGCYVRAHTYNRLDFQNYAGLSIQLYNTEHLTAELVLESDVGEFVLPLTESAGLDGGWKRYKTNFGSLPEIEIHRMTFRFRQTDTPYRFVNLECPRLLKK